MPAVSGLLPVLSESTVAASRALGFLDAPVRLVTAPHTPVPFSPVLEDRYVPDARRVVEAVRSII